MCIRDSVYDFVKTLEFAGDDTDIRLVSCVDQTSIDEHVAALIIFQYLAAAVGIAFRLQPGDNAVFDKRAEKSHGGLIGSLDTGDIRVRKYFARGLVYERDGRIVLVGDIPQGGCSLRFGKRLAFQYAFDLF